MSALFYEATCRLVGKRQRVAALRALAFPAGATSLQVAMPNRVYSLSGHLQPAPLRLSLQDFSA